MIAKWTLIKWALYEKHHRKAKLEFMMIVNRKINSDVIKLLHEKSEMEEKEREGSPFVTCIPST